MRIAIFILAVCLPTLSSCSQPPMKTGGPLPAERLACRADDANAALGMAPTDAIVERARTDAGAATVRVLRPGDVATMDLRDDRLNVHVNAAGTIERLSCG